MAFCPSSSAKAIQLGLCPGCPCALFPDRYTGNYKDSVMSEDDPCDNSSRGDEFTDVATMGSEAGWQSKRGSGREAYSMRRVRTADAVPDCVHFFYGEDDGPEWQPKTVYLIRHAESLENVTHAAVKRSFKSLTRWELPEQTDVDSTYRHLLDVGPKLLVNSPVSERGTEQINQLRKKLDGGNFLKSSGVEAVVHSPLTRARQTCFGMLGCIAEKPECVVADGALVMPVDTAVRRVQQLDLLTEKTPAESVPGGRWMLDQRIVAFEEFLRDELSDVNKIAVVGHSRFFQFMLDLPYMFDNCDVWELTFHPVAVSGVFSHRFHRDKNPIWTNMKRHFHYEEDKNNELSRYSAAVVTDDDGSD